jgi:hypothetical protein
MIELKSTEYNIVSITVSGRMLEATFTTRLNRSHIIPILTKLLFFGFFAALAFGKSFAFVSSFIAVVYLLLNPLYSKKILKINPFSRSAVPEYSQFGYSWSQQRIQWPPHYSLRYETKINAEGRIEEIILIAQSEDRTKMILIFSFPNQEVFEEFQKQYNTTFQDYPIRNV